MISSVLHTRKMTKRCLTNPSTENKALSECLNERSVTFSWSNIFTVSGLEGNVLLLIQHLQAVQCDQMSRIFAQNLAIYNNKLVQMRAWNIPKSVKFFTNTEQTLLESCRITLKNSKVGKFRQTWSHWQGLKLPDYDGVCG